MENRRIGILHPGKMGVFVAAMLLQSGHEVYWAADGRSAASARRARQHALRDAGTLAELCRLCDVLISVCPPAAAEELAGQVRRMGFRGLYVDANAIAPQRAERMSAAMEAAGIPFVDGSIIGGPAWDSGQTRLVLSGPRAAQTAELFAAERLAADVIAAEVGRASALKMCSAAYTKGTTAMLCAVLAAAEQLDVRAELEEQWSRDWPDFPQQTQRRVVKVTAKAWRFAGEMEEIATTFEAAGLPGDAYLAAAELFQRLAGFKDSPQPPSLPQVLSALRRDTNL